MDEQTKASQTVTSVSCRDQKRRNGTCIGAKRVLTKLVGQTTRQSGQDVRDECARVDHEHEPGEGEHEQVEEEAPSLAAWCGFRVVHCEGSCSRVASGR